MSYSRDEPFSAFRADQERVAAEVAAENVPDGGFVGKGLIIEAISSACHVGYAKIIDRRKLVTWVGNDNLWDTGDASEIVLCDIAGVSLINALNIGNRAMSSGVPPGRFARMLLAGVSESVQGGRHPQRMLEGFLAGADNFLNNGIVERALPRYRDLVLSAYVKALTVGRAEKQDIDFATSQYVHPTLSAVARAVAPSCHPSANEPIGRMIQSKSWQEQVRSRCAPLPPRGEIEFLRTRYNALLGLD